MKYYYILLFAFLVFVSACTQQTVNISNDGLKINDFTAEPKTAEFTDNVRFFMDVENTGSTTASCVKAELLGLGSWSDSVYGTYLSSSYNNMALSFNYYNKDDFRICYAGGLVGDLASSITGQNVRTNDRICYSEYYDMSTLSTYVDGIWGQFLASPFCTQDTGQLSRTYPELRPPQPALNRPGQTTQFDWYVIPPVLPEGQNVPYKVTGRVSYAYKSSANVNLPIISKAEYRRLTDVGTGPLPKIEIVNANAAPIQVAMKKGSEPIIVDNLLPGPQVENYLFEFQNVGDGFPLSPSGIGDDGFIFGTIEVRGPGTYFYECMGERNTNQIFVSNFAKLRTDNTLPFSCNVAVDRAYWVGKDKDTISIVFNLWYMYYTEEEVTVNVLGSREAYVR